MSEKIKFIRKIKDFSTRERVITIVSFFWLLVLMIGYYIIKPVRETFVNELPYQCYPYLLIGTMTAIFLVNFVYDFIARRFSSVKLITVITIFFGTCLCIFPYLLQAKFPYVTLPILGVQPGHYICIVSYSLFVGVYNLFISTLFWSFVNEVFRPDEARKFFGWVSAGGSIGGLMGSQITNLLASKIAIPNLIYLSVVLLIPTLGCMWLLLPYRTTEEKKEIKTNEPVKKESGLKLVMTSSYLQWMLITMFLVTSSGTMLGYQMNALVKTSIHDQAGRAEFWSSMNFWICSLGLFFQVFLVRFMVQRLGMMFTLLISPIIDFSGALLLTGSQILPIGSFCHIGRYSSEYSFNRAAKEMLYTPTSRDFKYQAKIIIDTFIFRAGDGLTSLLLIFMSQYPLYYVAILSIFANFSRIIPAIALAKHYKKLIEKEDSP